MKNLEIIRARNALQAATGEQRFERSDVNGLPALVQSCGLLATAAYVSTGQEARRGMRAAFDAVATHLRDLDVAILLERPQGGNESPTDLLIRELTRRDSTALVAATAETQAYLSYLKRFAR